MEGLVLALAPLNDQASTPGDQCRGYHAEPPDRRLIRG